MVLFLVGIFILPTNTVHAETTETPVINPETGNSWWNLCDNVGQCFQGELIKVCQDSLCYIKDTNGAQWLLKEGACHLLF